MKKASLKACQKLVGSRPAGELLFAMQLAHATTKIVRDDRPVMAYSLSQWCEKTGLCLSSVKRALKKLETDGLIGRERHMWNNKVAAHVYLTDKAILLLAKWANGSAQKWANQDKPTSGLIGKPTSGPIYIDSERIIEREERENAADAVGPRPPSAEVIQFPGHGGPMSTADELVNKYQHMDPVDLSKVDIKNGHHLKRLWQIECARNGIRCMNVGDAEQKMLKRVAEFAGVARIERAIRNWTSFITIARDSYGAFNMPEKPTIPFLLKYMNALMDLQDEANAMKVYDPNEVPVAPKAKPSAAPKGAKVATLAEVLAILNDEEDAA